jgi:uncharacterized iron-regulated membrane protein
LDLPSSIPGIESPVQPTSGLDYRSVWRWHFYAGLFCIPFVLWLACTGTQNRPLRVDLVPDPATGAILERNDFSSKPWLDRVIGRCIAAHEGQLFGIANQLLGLFTTSGLVTLSISGLIMWWRRRPESVLGAPPVLHKVRFSWALIALMVTLGVYFPFLGASMIFVALAERFVLRKIIPLQIWLGLAPA